MSWADWRDPWRNSDHTRRIQDPDEWLKPLQDGSVESPEIEELKQSLFNRKMLPRLKKIRSLGKRSGS
jgi:hypothetical protein